MVPTEGGVEGEDGRLPFEGGMEGRDGMVPTEGGVEGEDGRLPSEGGVELCKTRKAGSPLLNDFLILAARPEGKGTAGVSAGGRSGACVSRDDDAFPSARVMLSFSDSTSASYTNAWLSLSSFGNARLWHSSAAKGFRLSMGGNG